MTRQNMLARRASITAPRPVDSGSLHLSLGGVRQTSRRMFAVACTFAAIWTLVLVLFDILGPLMGGMPALRDAMWPMPGNLIAGGGLVVSLLLSWFVRRTDADAPGLMLAGSVFLVVTCFLFGLATHW